MLLIGGSLITVYCVGASSWAAAWQKWNKPPASPRYHRSWNLVVVMIPSYKYVWACNMHYNEERSSGRKNTVRKSSILTRKTCMKSCEGAKVLRGRGEANTRILYITAEQPTGRHESTWVSAVILPQPWPVGHPQDTRLWKLRNIPCSLQAEGTLRTVTQEILGKWKSPILILRTESKRKNSQHRRTLFWKKEPEAASVVRFRF